MLSSRARSTILFANATFLAIPCAIAVPITMLAKFTESGVYPVIIVFVTIVGSFLVDTVFETQVRTGIPNFPFRTRQYSAAQREWARRAWHRVLRSPLLWASLLGVPSLSMAAALFIDHLTDLWMTMPASRWAVPIAVSVLFGGSLGAALGRFVGLVRIRKIEEFLLMFPEIIQKGIPHD